MKNIYLGICVRETKLNPRQVTDVLPKQSDDTVVFPH